MEEVLKIVKEYGVFYLATIDGDKPRVRPFGVMEEFEGHLYILTGKKKDVFKQIEKNNKVEICSSKGENWIRIAGELIVDDRVEAKKNILDKNSYLRSSYNENDDNTAILYFKNAVATIYSFTEEPKIIKF